MASTWQDLNHGYTAAFSSSCSSELTNLSTEAPSEPARPALRGVLYGANERLGLRDAPSARVHWDEECIAEHDKERGTRQKIDEPDTPFVRSPTGSDDEAELPGPEPLAAEPSPLPATSSNGAPAKARARVQLPVEEEGEERRTLSPDAMDMLTDRLNEWVEIGSPQSHGRRLSKEEEKFDKMEAISSEDSSRRVSLVQAGESKSSSSSFKAQRAKHYNEFAAMKALKQQKFDSDSSAASDTSDEEALQKKRNKKGLKVETRADGDHSGESNSASKDEWRTKRNAHYRDMAAAFRSKAPEKDSDDSD